MADAKKATPARKATKTFDQELLELRDTALRNKARAKALQKECNKKYQALADNYADLARLAIASYMATRLMTKRGA
jgi:hypothetical protein